MSLSCMIVLTTLVGLDNNNVFSYLMGSLCDGMSTYNIGISLSINNY